MIEESKSQKYDFIIVLCPEKRGDDGKFPDFQGGKYLGGQVRMDAAVALYQKYPKAIFILVGGYDPKSEQSRKTHGMDCFLKEKNPKIITRIVNSLPCTKHNLVAIFNEMGKDLHNKRIGLLTNFYHLPRALRFWALLAEEEFHGVAVPTSIAAESFVPSACVDIVKLMDQYLRRVVDEYIGLRDIENGCYEDDCIDKKLDNFIGIIKKRPKILLTATERSKLINSGLLKIKKEHEEI